MSQPAVVQALPPPPHVKQYHKQQQALHEAPAPRHAEAIEMRPTTGFTRLPQDLPSQTQFSPPMEMTLSNGVIRQPVPDYQSPPTYAREDTQANPFTHQHNYEELPVSLPPRTDTSTEDINLQDRQGFQRQGSHTEVDQYYNPPVHSISSTPLTLTEPEKKPRKKVNPIYDRYQGPAERITTSKDGPEKTLTAPGKPRSVPWRCLRHPCTTAFIFVLVAVVIVAIVLIMLGTIETPALVGSPEKQVQTTPGAPLGPVSPSHTDELMELIMEQRRTIDLLQTRVQTLENLLGGETEVNASLSTKVAMNTVKVENVETSVTEFGDKINTLEITLSGAIANLASTTSRTITLENERDRFDTEIGALNGLVMNQATSIQTSDDKNGQQDMAIASLEQNLSNLDQRFGRELTMVNGSIYGELAIISKMPGPRGYNGSDGAPGAQGPQGPAGAGDLSQCTYRKSTDTSTFSYATLSSWISTPSDKVITGFTCSTSGGTQADLLTSESDGVTNYRCSCTGGPTTEGLSSRTCYTHYWDCPKQS